MDLKIGEFSGLISDIGAEYDFAGLAVVEPILYSTTKIRNLFEGLRLLKNKEGCPAVIVFYSCCTWNIRSMITEASFCS